jgi:bifunctional non-homologous end joining protein LigD
MGLKVYGRRRRFRKTPEPPPSWRRPAAGRRFVVQKHQATHLHYDLRLEHRGVLKSWAVPKGPPRDPRERRLAIQVEDHPLAYKDFQGRIPEGEYGAGLVEIWDKGTYTLDPGNGPGGAAKSMTSSLRDGHIDFSLHGEKLQGHYALVRFGDKDRQWLLLKRKGAPAGDPLRLGGPAGPRTPGKLDLSGAVKAPFPTDVFPMLATLVDRPFNREGWSFEVKWDGFRSLAMVKRGKVRLVSRNGKSQNERFPMVVDALSGFPREAVFDGEIVSVDDKGRPDFQALQNSMRTKGGRIRYFVFDVLYALGRDLRPLPLRRRRAILAAILPESKVVRPSESVEKQGVAYFQAAQRMGLEGVMAKDLASPYRSGMRTEEWLKIKIQKRQEAVIGGFTRPRASRGYFGALVLGAYDQDRLTWMGNVGTGFDENSLRDLYRRLKPLVRARSPFAGEPRTNAPATWVKPLLICEVKFSNWTSDGLMRQPVFLGLREDKSPREVKVERADRRGPEPGKPGFRTRAKLTHLDKVFWPKEGYTKSDLVDYYHRMANWILPYLKGRPQALNRHPDGVEGQSFFQKNLVQSPPPWVKTVRFRPKGEDRTVRYLVCQNTDTLLYEANLGCIEVNVWNSSIPHLDSPDYIVLDFDPLETSFRSVVEAVRAAKTVLDEMGLPAFCKTSGATGLHVYIPLAPRFSHEQARETARLVCLVVNRRRPDLTSLKRSPVRRKGRVYLDYLQNRREATVAAPYSLRPRDGAPVSTPLEWSEVKDGLEPLEFNIRTVPERLARRGDAWRGFFRNRVDLKAALIRIGKWSKDPKGLRSA